jgi:predicted AAA+ superfamily ATPase
LIRQIHDEYKQYYRVNNNYPNIHIMKTLPIPLKQKEQEEYFNILLKFGGFPEPLLKQEEKTLRRWHQMRLERITREDILDTERISDLSALQILVDHLPERVSSLLSINSLTEDLSVTHKTVKRWLDVLEHFYYHFRIYPYNKSSIKSLKKMPKTYLWDWSQIEDNPGAKFENLVACHLYKFCHFLLDTQGYKADLYYLRDKESREVDFLITINEKPWFAVEVKKSSKEVAKNLKYFMARMEIPYAYQVVQDPDVDFMENNIRVINAPQFLSALI